MNLQVWAKTALAAMLGASLLSACGPSGGGAQTPVASSPPPPPVSPPSSPPPPPAQSGPVWTPNVFEPASRFVNRCANVRTGVDIEGNSFRDQPGSTLQENFWLRSWTEETYLFNTEVVDQNPANFSTPVSYFDVLRTNAVTSSGKRKDEFHFVIPTDQYLRDRNSVASASYGAQIRLLAASPPRNAVVAFTEQNSPATTVVGGVQALRRGTRFLRVDGIDLVNGGATQGEIDILNNGLFPRSVGETHTFVVQDPNGPQRTITLTAAAVTPSSVGLTSTIDTSTGRVGYVLVNTFGTFASERAISDAVESLRGQNVSDLVLDLRYNGGGLLAVASELGYMVAGPSRTNNRIFERLRFNANAGMNDPVTGQPNRPTPFYNTAQGFSLPSGQALPTLNLPRVFVLATGRTCSASESVINSLRGIGVDVVLIGDRTCGKPFGFYPTDNCGQTYFTIQFQGVNDAGFGDYADGFLPANSTQPAGVRVGGCAVPDDFSRAFGDPQEGLLAAALQYRSSNSCPTPPVATASKPDGTARFAAAAALGLRDTRSPTRDILESSRDMTMP